MTLQQPWLRLLVMVCTVILLVGCRASGNYRAPIEDRSSNVRSSTQEVREASSKKSTVPNKKSTLRESEVRSLIYVVQKGDTLYSIAFEHGLDYREVAEHNNIENPANIQIGQQIKLVQAEESVSERPRIEIKPQAAALPSVILKKDQPKVGKLPYSEQAIAQIEKMQSEPAVIAVSPTPPVTLVVPIPKVVAEEENVTDENIEWLIPTKGKMVAEYSESANRKGVDIAGNKGQAIFASAAGKVVYSGSGLRGYGKLVIIKHNKTFLSAYAHNEQILVKEGQSVSKGQHIAEMGNSDAEQVKLHFEIRKFGKPVDPSKYLNFVKS
jgi:lipoprotein NlpD